MKKNIDLLYFSGLLIVPLVLIILPADFFDSGPPMCLSVLLLDMECYGCGMTRGIMHLIHFDFAAAASFNKLSFVVLPFLIFYWFTELRRSYSFIKK
ncbi:MAG: DUF2752 domain-containing protein [Bacteroidota bacterium]